MKSLRFTEEQLSAYKAKHAKAASIADGYSPHAVTIECATTGCVTELKTERGPNKYGNEETNGYQSRKESKRAAELKLLERAGEITELQEQVPFLLIPKQLDAAGKCIERSCKYFADFTYVQDGERIVEDSKSPPTRAKESYIIKRKLMLFVHHVRIFES
jgi:hypothetical protein